MEAGWGALFDVGYQFHNGGGRVVWLARDGGWKNTISGRQCSPSIDARRVLLLN